MRTMIAGASATLLMLAGAASAEDVTLQLHSSPVCPCPWFSTRTM